MEKMKDICRLCKKESELRNSHILPEFFYSGIYDELHRTPAITTDSIKKIQKGYREYLLCQGCETDFSRYEKYAADIIRDIPNFERDNEDRFLCSEHIDYSRLKLFQLSLLWRFSISKGLAFRQVNLGPHEETLRCMLVDQNPGSSFEYGCLMMIKHNPQILHKVISPPIRLEPRPFGQIAYKLMTGNLSWVFFINDHLTNVSLHELFVQEDGRLKVWLTKDEMGALLGLAKNLRRLDSKRKSQ